MFDSIHDLIGSVSGKKEASTTTITMSTAKIESGHMNANGEVFESIHDLINNVFDDDEESSSVTFRNPNDRSPQPSGISSATPSELKSVSLSVSPSSKPITSNPSLKPTVSPATEPSVSAASVDLVSNVSIKGRENVQDTLTYLIVTCLIPFMNIHSLHPLQSLFKDIRMPKVKCLRAFTI